jgi:biotin-(acetyl-CoA carboxylase) ligase
MNDTLSLPPIYRPVPIAAGEDPVDHAAALAAAGGDPATLVWAEREDRLDCAILLAPTEPLAKAARVLFCGVLGLGDALAALLPPGVDADFIWPGEVRVNERRAAWARLRAPADIGAGEIPDWLVLGAVVRVTGGPSAESHDGLDDAPETTLHFEDCFEIGVPDLLESYSRHFLAWLNRWLDDGFEPIRLTWTHRAYTGGTPAAGGAFESLTENGALRITADGAARELALLDALRI